MIYINKTSTKKVRLVRLTKKTIKQKEAKLRRRSMLRDSEQMSLLSMCLIPALFVFVFSYLPMYGLILAFKNFNYADGILGSPWAGLANFEFLVNSVTFWRMIRNTLGMNFLMIGIGTMVNVAVALMLFEIHSRKKIKTYQTLMLLPYFISWVIVSYIVYALLNPSFGVVNSILKSLGIEGIAWYDEPKYWPFILVFVSIWKGVGMGCVIYYASLMGLDPSLFEAAAIDGATKFQRVRHITIPSLIPIIVIQLILSVGHIMRADFGLFYQIPRDSGLLYPVTDVLDTYVYRVLKEQNNMSLSAATSFLQSFVSAALVLVTNYVVKKIEPDNALF